MGTRLSKRTALVYGFMFEANTTSQVSCAAKLTACIRVQLCTYVHASCCSGHFRGGHALQLPSSLDADWSQYDEEKVEQDDGELDDAEKRQEHRGTGCCISECMSALVALSQSHCQTIRDVPGVWSDPEWDVASTPPYVCIPYSVYTSQGIANAIKRGILAGYLEARVLGMEKYSVRVCTPFWPNAM